MRVNKTIRFEIAILIRGFVFGTVLYDIFETAGCQLFVPFIGLPMSIAHALE